VENIYAENDQILISEIAQHMRYLPSTITEASQDTKPLL